DLFLLATARRVRRDDAFAAFNGNRAPAEQFRGHTAGNWAAPRLVDARPDQDVRHELALHAQREVVGGDAGDRVVRARTTGEPASWRERFIHTRARRNIRTVKRPKIVAGRRAILELVVQRETVAGEDGMTNVETGAWWCEQVSELAIVGG